MGNAYLQNGHVDLNKLLVEIDPRGPGPLGLKRGRKGHMKTIISTNTKQGFHLRLDKGPL
jgi:hypothetical protein